MNDINVLDLVGLAINKQSGQDLEDLRLNQARAAIDTLSTLFINAIETDENFHPDGITVLRLMRLLARTPSEYFNVLENPSS